MTMEYTTLGKRIEALRKKIALLNKKIKAAEAADFKRKKKQEDRRKFLVGLFFYEGFVKKKDEKEMVNLMNFWLKKDRDRVIWGLPLHDQERRFNHDPERFEIRKKYHIGSYFLEKFRRENRFSILANLLEKHLEHPLDKKLFSP